MVLPVWRWASQCSFCTVCAATFQYRRAARCAGSPGTPNASGCCRWEFHCGDLLLPRCMRIEGLGVTQSRASRE
eukprot:316631-Amphidinium_carterae.1